MDLIVVTATWLIKQDFVNPLRECSHMNRSYKSLWNEKTQTFVAVAEIASNKGKKSSSQVTASGALSTAFRNVLLAIGLSGIALAVQAATGISGGTGAGTAASGDCDTAAHAVFKDGIAIGCESRAELDKSIAIGKGAQTINTPAFDPFDGSPIADGHSGIAIGDKAQVNGGISSIAIGKNAKVVLGNVGNTAGGVAIGQETTAVIGEVFIGNHAGAFRVDPGLNSSGNVGIGDSVGQRSKGGSNIMLGGEAGQDLDGYWNIVTGNGAGIGLVGEENTFSGMSAGSGTKGNWNVGIGSDAGSNVAGGVNVGIGYGAGKGIIGNNKDRKSTRLNSSH